MFESREAHVIFVCHFNNWAHESQTHGDHKILRYFMNIVVTFVIFKLFISCIVL